MMERWLVKVWREDHEWITPLAVGLLIGSILFFIGLTT